jgi:transposase
MRQVREILRQKWLQKQSHRNVHHSLGVSVGVISNVVTRAEAAKLSWSDVEQLDDQQLELLLYGSSAVACSRRPLPSPEHIHAERKKPGVTLELLHAEYRDGNPDGYGYTQFCEYYRRWLKGQKLSMHQEHMAGEKLFVDFSGKKPSYTNPKTGERIQVELFVAVLGASNYTYAEATRSQESIHWLRAHANALKFFEGVPGALVPDQLKSGVTVPCRYDPVTQRSYAELATHYGTVVLPARPRHPKDKPKVEVGVQVVQRWVLARLRNQTFFSLDELNERIAELLEDVNNRRMRRYQASRRELFERLDKPALKPLPAEPYEYAEWKKVGLNIDYHIQFDYHFYSLHYSMLQTRHVDTLEVRATAMTIEVYRNGKRIESHARSYVRGGYTTKPEHRPASHRAHAEWTPTRLIDWAATIGPHVKALVEAILKDRPHPEQGYRSCLGIIHLAKAYGSARLDAACVRGLAAGARTYPRISNILRNKLDTLPSPNTPTVSAPVVDHENIRGPQYYDDQKEETC